MKMTMVQALEVLQNERKCVLRNCNRKCKNCDLVRTEDEIVSALDIAMKTMLKQRRLKVEFFKSGTEFAKTEFIRMIETEKAHQGELHKSKRVDDLVYTQSILGLQKAEELAEEIRVSDEIDKLANRDDWKNPKIGS